jgi:GDP-4-dehydro-6-deoxy-D-mannose reductase
MRALITGASGFIGRHLAAHLGQAGDDVVESDRGGPDGIDLSDLEGARRLLAAAAPDVVYHLAGHSDVAASWADPIGTLTANATTTLCLMTAAAEAGVGRVIVASTADVYGNLDPASLPVHEDCELRPVSPYAASKVAAEYLAVQAYLGAGLGTVRVRLFNQIGPGQSDHFVVPALARQVAAAEHGGDPVIAVGNLSPVRDFTDVRDSVEALRLLSTLGAPGEVYNVCSGGGRSIEEVAALLTGLALRPLTLREDPARLRPVDLPVLIGDPTRLREVTGWKPAIGLERTLGDVLAEWREAVLAG